MTHLPQRRSATTPAYFHGRPAAFWMHLFRRPERHRRLDLDNPCTPRTS